MVAAAGMYLYNPLNGGLLLNPSTLYTSSDSGATWTLQSAVPMAGAQYVDNWVAIASSADGTRLVASVNEYNSDYFDTTNSPGVAGGIYLSSDSGASWHAAGGMPNWSTWRAVASSADGNTLAAISSSLSVSNTGPALFVSTDGGGSWQQANFLKQPVSTVAVSGDGRTIVAAGTNIVTSTDSGGDWVVQPGTPQGTFGTYHWTSLAASADGTKLVAGTSLYTIYASADSGVTWTQPYNLYTDFGWIALASSADGLELVALPVRDGSGYGTNLDYRDIYTLQTPLVASITATPQSVQLTNTISVVFTVFNSFTNPVTDVSLDGSITVAGTGGVAPAGFSGPTLTASLAPGTSTSFTYLYTSTNYGTVNFTASATCTGPGGVVTSPPATSGNVVIAPRADLMVKTADTNDTTFAGEDEFQQPPPYNDQNWTLRVGNNGSAGYVVRLQNDTGTARTFALLGTTNGYTNWNVQVLSGGVNILGDVISANGWTTPQLAPGAYLDLSISLAPLSGASVLENKSLLLMVQADSSNTNVLDSVLLHAMLVPVPVQLTVLALNQNGLSPASITAGLSDINAPLVPVTDPTLLNSQQEIHGGLVADGVTPLVIKLAADPASLGQFANGRDFVFQATTFGPGTLNGNTVNQRLLLLQDGAWEVATDVVLTAADPTAYVELTPITSDDVSLSGLTNQLGVDFSVVDNASGVQSGDIQFGVRKPPIALLHGYNTDGNWGSDFKTILGTSRPYEDGNSLDNFVCTVKYGQDTNTSLTIFQSMPVYVNTIASLDNCAQLANAAFQQTMAPLHSAWAFTRYDVVAHSQGGLLTRMLCSANSNSVVSEPFRNPDNFYRGRFNRVVTIGSPQNGTRLLHYLLKLNQLALIQGNPGFSQWLAAAGFKLQIAQPKFDPFGPQIAEINNPSPSAAWYPDPAANFHLIVPVIDNGLSPVPGDTTPSYILLGLALPYGGETVIPRGSDGVVDFDSIADNVPPTPLGDNVFLLPPVNDVSHSEPTSVFASAATETTSTTIAWHAIDALDQDPTLPAGDRMFGSFVLPPALDPSVETNIDNYASSSTFSNIINSLALSPQPRFAGNSYQYQFVFPANLPPQGTVAWLVQVYGPSGITTDGVELSVSGANDSEVTVTVDAALVGDVVLTATYTANNNTVVTTQPLVVISQTPAGATLTGIQVLPANIALPPGSIVSPQVVANYSDGSSSLRYVTAGAFVVTSSQPSVVSVSDPLNWQFSAIGAAKVTLTWSGFSAVSQLTVFDPSGNTPPMLSLANAGNGQLTFSWPGFTTSYQLESSTNLTDTNAWQPVVTTPVSAGGQSFVTLSATNGQQFYRLQLMP
jgi:hypothetical protein